MEIRVVNHNDIEELAGVMGQDIQRSLGMRLGFRKRQ